MALNSLTILQVHVDEDTAFGSASGVHVVPSQVYNAHAARKPVNPPPPPPQTSYMAL